MASWNASDIAVPCTHQWVNPNESFIIELNDGSGMLKVRSKSMAESKNLSMRRTSIARTGTSQRFLTGLGVVGNGWRTPMAVQPECSFLGSQMFS